MEETALTERRVRASILIPTHNRQETLRLAVQSALAQTVQDIEVILIGDGVTAELRTAARELQRSDDRVVFLDREKSPHHGEPYRHDAIVNARSDAIFYLCDDDLFLPDHVADLLGMLETNNFVQCRNGHIRPSGEVDFYPADLSDPETIQWHRREDIRFNAVSLTGTAHTREFYLRVGKPWTTTPAGEWPDHYQWRKLFSSDELRAATSPRMTIVQLPTTADGRDTWTPQARLDELRRWAEVVAAPDAQETIDALVARDSPRRMERDMRLYHELGARHADLERRYALLSAHLDAMHSTVSWRITRPLRFVRALLGRGIHRRSR